MSTRLLTCHRVRQESKVRLFNRSMIIFAIEFAWEKASVSSVLSVFAGACIKILSIG